MAERRRVDQRLIESNPRLWDEVLTIDHQVRSAIDWGLQVSDAHASHPCGENWCQRCSLPDPSTIERCVSYMDAFFQLCTRVDVARANQLAAIAFLFVHQHAYLELRRLAAAAKEHHGRHGCHLPWCLDIN